MHIGFKTRLQEISVAGQLFGSAKSRGLKSASQFKICTIQSGGVRLLNRLCGMFSEHSIRRPLFMYSQHRS